MCRACLVFDLEIDITLMLEFAECKSYLSIRSDVLKWGNGVDVQVTFVACLCVLLCSCEKSKPPVTSRAPSPTVKISHTCQAATICSWMCAHRESEGVLTLRSMRQPQWRFCAEKTKVCGNETRAKWFKLKAVFKSCFNLLHARVFHCFDSLSFSRHCYPPELRAVIHQWFVQSVMNECRGSMRAVKKQRSYACVLICMINECVFVQKLSDFDEHTFRWRYNRKLIGFWHMIVHTFIDHDTHSSVIVRRL